MDVDVVMVNYHSPELVLACLDSLAAGADGLAVRVTVIDNGSTDDLAARLAVGARSTWPWASTPASPEPSTAASRSAPRPRTPPATCCC